MEKRCAIVHYRIGKTDGVSLEIAKRKQILEKMGYSVKLISGPRQAGADYVIPELEFDRKEIIKIKENAFFKLKDYKTESEFRRDLYRISDIIERKFLQIYNRERFDYIFLHNIFTHGRHIAAARSFYNIALHTKARLIGVNHDFYWTGSYKKIYKPTTEFIKRYLRQYVPPSLPRIQHFVINSISQTVFQKRTGIKPLIVPDIFDFNRKEWVKNNYNRDFLNRLGIKKTDLVVLQATRISARKGIELAIDFVDELNKQKGSLIGRRLYNGKVMDRNSDIILVLAGYAEKDSFDYQKKLRKKIQDLNIKSRFIAGMIEGKRQKRKTPKTYSFWEPYLFSDLITFPSLWEGWGNQFLEGVFSKKPIVVFEYPVFIKDIKPRGFKVISLGKRVLYDPKTGLAKIDKNVMKRAAEESIKVLTDREGYRAMVERNFKIARENFSYKNTFKLFRQVLI